MSSQTLTPVYLVVQLKETQLESFLQSALTQLQFIAIRKGGQVKNIDQVLEVSVDLQKLLEMTCAPPAELIDKARGVRLYIVTEPEGNVPRQMEDYVRNPEDIRMP